MEKYWKFSSSVKQFKSYQPSTLLSPARRRPRDSTPKRNLIILQTPSRIRNTNITLESFNTRNNSIPSLSRVGLPSFTPSLKTYVTLSSDIPSFDLRGKSIEKDLSSIQNLIQLELQEKKRKKSKKEYKKLTRKTIKKLENERKELNDLSPEVKKPHLQASEFFYEIKKGNEEKVFGMLIQHPELVKEQDSTGQTGLHWACRRSNISLVKMLIQNGANILTKDMIGRVAEDIARSKNLEPLFQILISERKALRSSKLSSENPASRFINQLVKSRSKNTLLPDL